MFLIVLYLFLSLQPLVLKLEHEVQRPTSKHFILAGLHQSWCDGWHSYTVGMDKHTTSLHTSWRCCLWFGCVLQIGGKHANFRPTGEAAGSNWAILSSKHTQNSEKGKTHQHGLQLSEIIAVVKIRPSSERHVSHKHVHIVDEVIMQTYTQTQALLKSTHAITRIHKHLTTSNTNIYFKLNTGLESLATGITPLAHKHNGPIGTFAPWHHPHVGSGVLSDPKSLII